MNDSLWCRVAAPNKGGRERLFFAVEAGGRELWRSAAIGMDTPAVRVDVAMHGATELVLRAWDVDRNNDWGHANWAEVEFELADGHVARLGAFAGQARLLHMPPFSFRLGGKPSAELLGDWQVTRAVKPGADGVNVQVDGDAYLRRSRGSPCTIADFEYQITPLAAGETIQMVAGGGRPSNTWLPFFYGDYYPLTAGTPASDAWLVMQYHRPDLGEGMLLAFRRTDSPFVSAEFGLQGIEPAAEYELEDAHTGKQWKQPGKELRERGLRVNLEDTPDSRLVFYQVLNPITHGERL